VERQVAALVPEEWSAFGKLSPRVAIRENFSRGTGILNYLNEVEADLVILGGRQRESSGAGLPGITTESMIHDAPCSVLALHAEEEPLRPSRKF
jgi:nucleotide-binding universal stress UspA family protein